MKYKSSKMEKVTLCFTLIYFNPLSGEGPYMVTSSYFDMFIMQKKVYTCILLDFSLDIHCLEMFCFGFFLS